MTLDIEFVAPEDLVSRMAALREEGMDFLKTLTGMDWGEEGLGVVYQLENTATQACCALRTLTPNRHDPILPSIHHLWAVAHTYEREVYDFFGIRFANHPDMRRLFLREDWVGYPLRKDDEPAEHNPLRMDNHLPADETTQITLGEDGSIQSKNNTIFSTGDYVINIGPQHPATHGVLHFRVSLEGEMIRKVDPILGYIHRSVEKLSEELTYPQTLAFTDRLDYLSAHHNRHALCACIEQAMGIEVSERVQYIRTIMDELQRIDSHLLFFACVCMDLGGLTPFFYGFRDREKILDIFEKTCGGRLIMNYNKIGGLQADLHPEFQSDVKAFIKHLRGIIHEYHDIFTHNVIAQGRMRGVGVLSRDEVIAYGCTGGTGRASGWHNDVRKRHPYALYDKVEFKEIVRTEGDSFARYMVRMDEIMESLYIIEQLIDNIPEGNIQEKTKPVIKVPEGTYYHAVESARGEFGVFLESRGDKKPYRLHYRSTGLPLVMAINTACRGAQVADLIAIGATMDYIVPDIDR